MESEDPDDCRETFLEEENHVREEPVQFNESLVWPQRSIFLRVENANPSYVNYAQQV